MNLPNFSCITVTYGRTNHVNNVLAAFLAQDYAGLKELIVLNTCPEQFFVGPYKNVTVINLPARPASLGQARNMAIQAATGEVCVTFDDDDGYTSKFLSVFAKYFTPDIDWVWLARQFYTEGGKIRAIVQGTCNVVAFRKTAWTAVGGYPKLTCGEDRGFVASLTSTRPGTRARIEDKDLCFFYAWGNDVYHASGLGDDISGRPTAHARLEQDFKTRVAQGKEPKGKINLFPHANFDYDALAAEFLNNNAALPTPDETDVCIVQLGKAGDLINILPIARNLFLTEGRKPYLMVSKEFAPILDGVSYVHPYVVDLTFHDLHQAVMLANEKFSRVIKTQIYGRGNKQETLCPSWPQESWRQGGCLEHFHDPEWRLVFDQRSPAREKLLIQKLFRTTKPKIVTNLTSAVSVPFPNGDVLLRQLTNEFGKQYEVVDIGKLRAERIYDLIGVYEKAAIIVSIDTSTMHLAAAVDVPLVALVNPSHWLGPVLRYNCVERIPYTQADAITVFDAVRKAPEWMKNKHGRDHALRVLAAPPKDAARLALPSICLWACAWSDDENNLLRTLRVLRYCSSIIHFGDVLMFSYLPLPETLGFPCRRIQIPPLSPESWNVLHVHTLPHLLPSSFTHYMSIHEDGFPLDVSKWDSDFTHCDYIGAPWPDGLVGNGGFCLESRAFLDAKTSLPFMRRLVRPVGTTFGMLHFTPSDDYVCKDHRKALEGTGLKFAPVSVAARFSTELTHGTQQSFGFHGRKAAAAKYQQGWRLIEETEKGDLK